jgi:hypothetical protein
VTTSTTGDTCGGVCGAGCEGDVVVFLLGGDCVFGGAVVVGA